MRSDPHAFSQALWYIFLRPCAIAPIEAAGLNCNFSGEILWGDASWYTPFGR
jgi:hypothetical protein